MRRSAAVISSVLALAGFLALTAAPASAESTYARNFEGQITGFGRVIGLSTDPAGDLWVTDGLPKVHIDEYSPFPSLAKIGEQNGQGQFEEGTFSLSHFVANAAFDGVNGFLYVANGKNHPNIQVFDPHSFVEEWSIGSGNISFVAIDESGGSANGRIYVATYDPQLIRAFEPGQVPAPFSCATCNYEEGGGSYVEGATIVGTPAGPFDGEMSNIAVDSHGNIFVGVGHYNKSDIDEFKPSGEFVRRFPGVTNPAVDRTNDHLLGTEEAGGGIAEYSPSGELLDYFTEGAPGESLALSAGQKATDPSGRLYVGVGHLSPIGEHEREVTVVDIFSPAFILPKITVEPATNPTRNSVTLNATVSPNGGEDITSCHLEYGINSTYGLGSAPCAPDPGENSPSSNFSAPTEVHADLSGLTPGTTYHYRLLVANAKGTQVGDDQTYTTRPAVAEVETGPANPIGAVSATLHGSFTSEAGIETKYFFEYGTSSNFGDKEPVPAAVVPAPVTPTQVEHVETQLENLVPNTVYHYRFVAENHYGSTPGEEREFTTLQPPTIEAISSSELSATGAVLRAEIDPDGFETKYRFSYGATTSYGQTAPEPEGTIAAELSTSHSVEAHIEGLQRGVTYHFRLIAESRWGAVTSEDQSFEFFPPACPNAAVRQQTGTAYLPDCRAYELVSPGNANGTLYFAGGPNPGTATSPSRFSYVGAFGAPPGAEDTTGTAGDLYVATRTDTGWVSHYVGLPSTQAGCMSGPPGYPWDYSNAPNKIQDAVFTDPSMSHLLDWATTDTLGCFFGGNGTGDASWATANSSNAPYLWSAEGELIHRLPTGLSPAAEAALRCPLTGDQDTTPHCSSEVIVSADLNHFFFSSDQYSFSEPPEPAGLTSAPGSAYDYDLATGRLTLISRLPGGADIPADPAYAAALAAYNGSRGHKKEELPEEYLRFPAVSTDGSHVLISTATVPTPRCDRSAEEVVCPRFTDTPIHLYMSVDDAAVRNISFDELTDENVAVDYVGMTADGSRVLFTSEQHLTDEDPEHGGRSLYMWSEKGEQEGHPLTLISKGQGEEPGAPGNTAACTPASASYRIETSAPAHERPWTVGCGALPYSDWAFAKSGVAGGNAIADTAIASQNGDIYFFSPEQLDGDRGVLGQQNLYDYREGRDQFVATFTPGQYCQTSHESIGGAQTEAACTEGPIARIQVTPDDTHMAFVTSDRLTPYENAGRLEMYSYEPATRRLTCDSCNPSGRPATADVSASQDGLFLTEDGRAFFSTEESLVPSDTNQGIDVYEYVDGRPQLITPGTGTGGSAEPQGLAEDEVPGLVGVSANGTDVYFSTLDTLTSEDHNGDFLKFYDARTDGGFPQPTPNQPCAAAEECHGPGTEPPTIPTQGTAATLAGGNAKPESDAKHDKKKHHLKKHHLKKHHKKAAASRSTAKHRHARAGANRGGSK